VALFAHVKHYNIMLFIH